MLVLVLLVRREPKESAVANGGADLPIFCPSSPTPLSSLPSPSGSCGKPSVKGSLGGGGGGASADAVAPCGRWHRVCLQL